MTTATKATALLITRRKPSRTKDRQSELYAVPLLISFCDRLDCVVVTTKTTVVFPSVATAYCLPSRQRRYADKLGDTTFPRLRRSVDYSCSLACHTKSASRFVLRVMIPMLYTQREKIAACKRRCSESKVTAATFIWWLKCCGRRPHSPVAEPLIAAV